MVSSSSTLQVQMQVLTPMLPQIASQIMPFGDLNVMGQWGACEAAVYAAVAS